MRKTLAKILFCITFLLTGNYYLLHGQVGHRSIINTNGLIVNVTFKNGDNPATQLTDKAITVYDDGVEQKIKNFIPDRSPASIIILVDGSLTTTVDIEKLEQTVREFSYEIYNNDKLFIVKYANEAEIEVEWTDNAELIGSRTGNWEKAGEPYLFDALSAVINEVVVPLAKRKCVLVVVTDGTDQGSKTSFENVIKELQFLDVATYVIKFEDRTHDGVQRDDLRSEQVIEKLTKGTGGLAFNIEEARDAAKIICDELRKNRYLLSYNPTGVRFDRDRRILILDDQGKTIRSKAIQPSNQKTK